MINPSRTMIITALLMSAVAWVGSVDAQLDAAHAAKLSAVRDHLGDASQDVVWSELAKACERSAALEAIAVDADAGGVAISLELTDAVPYAIGFDSEAHMLTVDLAGAIALPEMRTLLLDAGGAVGTVEAGMIMAAPAFVTRATVPLDSPVSVTAQYDGTRLVIDARKSDRFTVSGGTPQADFVDAMLGEAEARGTAVAEAANALESAIGDLQTALSDAKLVLLEQEFAGIGAGEARDAAVDDLEKRIDSLALDIERLASARQTALNARTSGYDALRSEAGASDIQAIAEQLAAVENATVQRLHALAKAADARRDEVVSIAQQTEASFSVAKQDDAVFDALEGAFTEFRAEPAAPAELAGLDAAMDEVAALDLDMAIDTTPLAAVKASADPMPKPAPPAKRLVATESAAPVSLNGPSMGKMTFQNSGGQPIRLAQNMEAREDIQFTAPQGASFQLYRRGVPPEEDPLQQPVTIDFRDMDLLNVVSLLAEKGEINVIAGTEVRGTVTASLQDIPLGRAIEIILRMNGLGIVEEAGVYRITTYEEAVESRRETRIIFLQNTRADDIEETMRQAVRGPEASTFQVSANEETNTVVLSGPADLVDQMAAVVQKLDVTEQAIPTVTRVFQLNHAVPTDLETIVEDIVSNEGEVNSDIRSRQLVVTDTPGKVADIEELVAKLDQPVKQVAIEATVADVVMDDASQTGVDWVISRLPSGNVQDATLAADFPPTLSGATAALSILSGDFDIDLMLLGEVTNNNAEILANPVVVTVENSPARITIAEEFPFQEVSETGEGGRLTSTNFKDIGTVLEVTPRITYDNEIVVAISVQQSSVSGFVQTSEGNIPIEDEREVLTTLRINDGQTVFIGGLRKFQDSVGARKMPLLGSIPVLGVLFSNRSVSQDHVELLVFLTCNVIENSLPELTPYQQERYDDVAGREMQPDSERVLVESYIHPEIYRDPFYKWRRDK